MGHVKTNPLPEGTGDGVCGMDPAVGIQNILGLEGVSFLSRLLPMKCYIVEFAAEVLHQIVKT